VRHPPSELEGYSPMKIKRAPSGRNAYWFEDVGEHEILHLGCFAEPLDESLKVYADLLTRLYLNNPSLWIEFQSPKRWWLNQRRRDRKLSWKAPIYEDESYLAFDLAEREEILDALRRFWLLKELRCYFWKEDSSCLPPRDILPRLARTEFKNLTQYVPSAARFIAERDVCNSYLRVLFQRAEEKLVDKLFADAAAKSGFKFLLEASIFKAGVD
jgi:hypothetical protein